MGSDLLDWAAARWRHEAAHGEHEACRRLCRGPCSGTAAGEEGSHESTKPYQSGASSSDGS